MRIGEGPTLRPGMDDARVPALRERLKVAGDQSSTKYDAAVADAVKSFQRNAGLSADGLLGAGTVRALNGGPRARAGNQVDIILANMERWRWMPRDLGKVHVVLNIPDYTLRVYNDGAVVWQTKVVVGKPATATPILTETMKFITVNPTWNVPPSIVYNEYLPALQQDPSALSRIGVKVDAEPRRQRAHVPAARRQQRARTHPLQLPQQVPGLPARHAGQASVQARQARLQPWLHAGGRPAEICRSAARPGACPRRTIPSKGCAGCTGRRE